MNPKVKTFLALTLSLFLIAVGSLSIKAYFLLDKLNLTVDKVNKTIDESSPSLISTINSSKSTATKIDNFITPERLKYLDEAARAQIDGTNQATQGAAGVTLATITTLEEFVQPAIADFRKEGKETFAEIKTEVKELQNLTRELTHQVNQNGDEVKALLEQGKSIIVKSEPELLTTLAKIKETSERLEILTNDPALAQTLRNIDSTSYSVSLISKDLSNLSHHFIDPIVNPKPPKNKFDKFLVRPTIKVLRVLNGYGNVLFFLDRVIP